MDVQWCGEGAVANVSELAGVLVFLLELKGMTQRALAEASGIDPSYINKIVKGRIKKPEVRTLLKIANALGVPIQELTEAAEIIIPEHMYRELGIEELSVVPQSQLDPQTQMWAMIGRQVVELVQRSPLRIVSPDQYEATDDREEDMVEVDVYDSFAADQLGTTDRQVQERVRIPRRLLASARRPLVILITGNCLALRGIIRGDYVIVDAERKDPHDGEMVAFRFQGGESVKVFRRVTGKVLLEPTVEPYKTIVVHADVESDLEIVGVVTAWWQVTPRV